MITFPGYTTDRINKRRIYQTKPTDKCQSIAVSINMSFSEEDNIGDHLEDDVVKEALESGQDLREYSK